MRLDTAHGFQVGQFQFLNQRQVSDANHFFYQLRRHTFYMDFLFIGGVPGSQDVDFEAERGILQATCLFSSSLAALVSEVVCIFAMK